MSIFKKIQTHIKRLSRYDKASFLLLFVSGIGYLLGYNTSTLFFVSCFLLSFSIYKDQGQYNGEKIYCDPFEYLRIKGDQLVLGEHIIPLSKIDKVVLTQVEELGYFSLPFNQINGKPPSFYFDKGLSNDG